ncbi:RWD-domain-containing protein [Collybia nuda]|uniref:RWD-domain-containing protein n=1 Tax=Collybia nuda TaxID=64659 RepID=A0A9P6CFZ3_9AGAR|nr:RWD-domain-containing protein [Collybia nuda]
MSSDVLLEELEVLESIYPAELSKISERDIQIDVEPDDPIDGAEELKLTLCVHYTDEYPNVLPELSLQPVEGRVDDEEIDGLLKELGGVVRANTPGEENIGMAMTFTLVSQLREQLSRLVRLRAERYQKEEMEKERLALEEEEARTRGTSVTVESFRAWKFVFDKEMKAKKAQEDDEKLKSLTPKERDEWRRVGTRLSGRQLFERGDKNLEDDTLLEEGAVSVDVSQFERVRVEEEEDIVTFSDSD